MNRVTIAIFVALLLLAGWLGWALSSEQQLNRRHAAQLAQLRASLAAETAALQQNRQSAEALSVKVSELVMVLTNSTAELSAARQRIMDLESQAPPPAIVLATAPKDEETQRLITQCAPTVTSRTNASGQEVRASVFPTLYGKNNQVLGRDLEYSAVYGRRVAFKEGASARRLVFDVDELHPYVLAHLGINADQQKQRQVQQDEVWRRAEAASLKLAAEEEQKREAKRVAEAAARAEAEKQMAAQAEREYQQELQRQALFNDSVRANAAMRAADAALYHALNPPPVIINPLVRPLTH